MLDLGPQADLEAPPALGMAMRALGLDRLDRRRLGRDPEADTNPVQLLALVRAAVAADRVSGRAIVAQVGSAVRTFPKKARWQAATAPFSDKYPRVLPRNHGRL